MFFFILFLIRVHFQVNLLVNSLLVLTLALQSSTNEYMMMQFQQAVKYSLFWSEFETRLNLVILKFILLMMHDNTSNRDR